MTQIFSTEPTYITTTTNNTGDTYVLHEPDAGITITGDLLDDIINQMFDVLAGIHPDLPYEHPLMLALEDLAGKMKTETQRQLRPPRGYRTLSSRSTPETLVTWTST